MAVKTPALTGNTTTTVGTGAYALGGALPAPFRSLASVLSDGDQFYYCCRDNVNFEEGVGTYHSASGGTVTRTTVISSSNANVAVNWSSGTRNLFADFPSAGLMAAANNLSEITSQATAQSNLGLGTAALVDTAAAGGGAGEAGEIPLLDAGGNIPLSMLGNVPGSFPSGTALPFYQDAAPTGWTRVTSLTDKLLTVTKGSSSGDTTGGTSDSGTGGWDNSWGLTVGGTQLVTPNIPQGAGGAGSTVAISTASFVAINSASAHTHTMSSSSQWRPPAVYLIIATKNA
jgi:hypothetical protein